MPGQGVTTIKHSNIFTAATKVTDTRQHCRWVATLAMLMAQVSYNKSHRDRLYIAIQNK